MMMSHSKHYIAYLRLSKKQKAKEGKEEPDYYGLEAQRKTITEAITRDNGILLKEYCEVESGRKHGLKHRIEVRKAVQHCKDTGATLIVAKLDRLARDVEFTANVINSGIEVMFCDFPHAGKLVIIIIAAVAEYEGERISQRTKEGLAIAKARGVKLGNPAFGTPELVKKANAASHASKKLNLHNTPNVKLKGRVELMKIRDGLTLNQIAAKLNEEGLRSTMGKPFNKLIVQSILKTPEAVAA